jgi:arsenite methyltransferase
VIGAPAAPPAGGEAAPLPAPGGPALLARAFELAALAPGARVLDVGCGEARSAAWLRERLGLRAVGLDLLDQTGARAHPEVPRLRADGGCLPLADGAVEAVLLECVLSAAADRGAVLAECARVLVPGGRLVLLDLYARGPAAVALPGGLAGGCGARLLPQPVLAAELAAADFRVLAWEDRSQVLRELIFRRIMEGAPCCAPAPRLGGERRTGSAGPGYLLLVAALG